MVTGSFVLLVSLTMANGEVLEAVGDSFTNYDECLVEAEYQAKSMNTEMERVLAGKNTPAIFKSVTITCGRVAHRR